MKVKMKMNTKPSKPFHDWLHLWAKSLTKGPIIARVILAVALISALLPAADVAAGAAQPTEIRLRVATPAYTLDDEGLHVPGYMAYDAAGAPALPVYRTVVELPATGDWRVSYTSAGEQIIPVHGSLPAAPAPRLDLDGPDPATALPNLSERARFVERPDPAICGANAFYPATPVQTAGEGQQRGRRLLALNIFPFQYNPVRGELRYHPELNIEVTVAGTAGAEGGTGNPEDLTFIRVAPRSPASLTQNNTGALRIYTGGRGMYRLTYADLVAAGVPVAEVDPATLAMSNQGDPIAIEVAGADDGRFDPGDLVIFYAEPYAGRYMTQNVYWLVWGDEPGIRMAERPAAPSGGLTATSIITRTARVERDRLYYSNYNLPPEHDHFFDNPLYPQQPPGSPTAAVTYPFPLDNVVTAGYARLSAALYGGLAQAANPDQSVAVSVNDNLAGVYQWDGSVLHTFTDTLPAEWLTADTQIRLEAGLDQLPGLTSYWVVPDWVELSYPALAIAKENRLYIEGWVDTAPEIPGTLEHFVYLPLIRAGDAIGAPAAAASEDYQIAATGFTASDIRSYDVSDARRPVRLTGTGISFMGGAYTVRFDDPGRATGRYYLAADGGLLAPASIVADTPSTWRTPEHEADYIAIVHRSLWDAVQPLLDHRSGEGLRVAKVDVQDIYDEWNGGRVDPEAIRDFLSYAYHHWNADQEPPTYVLLVGDGHYDFKNVLGTGQPNLIPPYLLNIDPWIGETAADNRFVSVDGPADYLPDMAVGRIPARNPNDVAAVVAKILAYENTTPDGPWQERVTFVADNYADPAGNFHALSDQIRVNDVPTGYETPRLYYRLDATLDTAAKMRAAIKGAFGDGALILQWFGHASRARWGSVDMFNTTDIPTLTANTTWPFTASYACWSGYFINMSTAGGYGSVQTLAEQLLLTPGRGAVADFSPSGLHIGSALLKLDSGLTRAALQDRQERVGLAADAAKLYYYANSTAWHDVIDTQILFGDPATRLRLPAEAP